MSTHAAFENTLDTCLSSLEMWKKLIQENLHGEYYEAELAKLKGVTQEYCKIQSDFELNRKVVQSVKNQLDQKGNESHPPVEQLFEENLGKVNSSNNNYLNSDVWQRVIGDKQEVVEVKQKKTVLKESDYVEVNNSIMCSTVFTPPIDPISKTVITQPYRNKNCHHVYEYEYIKNYLKQTKNKTRCPYIGCQSYLTLSDLKADNELSTQIAVFLENQTEVVSDSEDSD